MNSPLGYTWGSIALMVTCSTVGDVMISKTMKSVGDLGEMQKHAGLLAVIRRVTRTRTLWIGLFFMAITFYTLLFALSHADVSLIVPATTSLTFVTNAFAARFYLHENVDRRRWLAALFVCVGVALLAG
jgi:multidrug transporter EmrE-like cation transporter